MPRTFPSSDIRAATQQVQRSILGSAAIMVACLCVGGVMVGSTHASARVIAQDCPRGGCDVPAGPFDCVDPYPYCGDPAETACGEGTVIAWGGGACRVGPWQLGERYCYNCVPDENAGSPGGGNGAAGGGDVGGGGGNQDDAGNNGGQDGNGPLVCREQACEVDADCAGGEQCDKDEDDPTKDACWLENNVCVKKCEIPRCIRQRCMMFAPEGTPTAPYTPCDAAACPQARCGDRIVQATAGEECDDGNTDAQDGCNASCKKEVCGDGTLQAKGADGQVNTSDDEECDDGNRAPGDGCSNVCKLETCGNGRRDRGEECDDGLKNSDTVPGACRTNCRQPDCGDGIVDNVDPYEEQCDCGIPRPAACTLDALGNWDPPECGGFTCSYAGPNGEAGNCTSSCRLQYCGNGTAESYGVDGISGTPDDEMCDAGPLNSNDPDAVCRLDCKYARCGDGIIDTGVGELCDDGPDMFECQGWPQPTCGCAIPTWGSADENGNDNQYDMTCCGSLGKCIVGSSDTCSVGCGITAVCGNGRVEGGEECDSSGFGTDIVFRVNGDGTRASFGEDDGRWITVPHGLEHKYTAIDHAPDDSDADNAYIRSASTGTSRTYFHLWDVPLAQGAAQGITLRISVDFTGGGTWQTMEISLPLDPEQRPFMADMNAAVLMMEANADTHELSFTLVHSVKGTVLSGRTVVPSPVPHQSPAAIAIDALELIALSSNPNAGDCVNCQVKRCGNFRVEPEIGEQCDDGNAVAGDGCTDRCALEICALPQ